MNIGTPKTLRAAIINALEMKSVDNGAYTAVPALEAHISDFIKQKFTVVMMSENPEEIKAAQKLLCMLGLVPDSEKEVLV